MQDQRKIYEKFSSQRLLIGVSGSIAAMGLPQFLIMFQQLFNEIKIVLTPSVTQFIAPNALRYICPDVYVEDENKFHSMTHAQLASWADIFLVMPATANTLAYAAHGFAHNLLTQTILCYERRVLFFPNMNRRMWLKNTVQRNIAQLVMDGHIICPPIEREAFEQSTRSIQKNFQMPGVMESLEFIVKCETENLL